jgi:hypothetical protein
VQFAQNVLLDFNLELADFWQVLLQAMGYDRLYFAIVVLDEGILLSEHLYHCLLGDRAAIKEVFVVSSLHGQRF